MSNFFENPKAIIAIANSLELEPARDGAWPGKRTKMLHEVLPEYSDYFNKKLMRTFYDFRKHDISWQIESYFQFIYPYGTNKEVNQGWVHKDKDTVMAGVVYLNENPQLDAGTSLFVKKEVYNEPINCDQKHTFFKDSSLINEQEYLEKLKENNNLFTETLNVGNVFNRLVCYDGSYYHRANSFLCNGEPRLTQVFFIRALSADWFPIPSMQAT